MISLQEKLLSYPVTNIIFHSPFCKQEIFFEEVVYSIPKVYLTKSSILFLTSVDDCEEILTLECILKMIQDTSIKAIIISSQRIINVTEEVKEFINSESLTLIQLTDKKIANRWIQTNEENKTSYISMELQLLMECDIEEILFNVVKGIDISFIYLNEDYRSMMEIGNTDEITRFQRWLNNNLRRLVIKERVIEEHQIEVIDVHIANVMEHHLVLNKMEEPWKKKWMNKILNLMAIFIHTNTLFSEQQLKLKEHFIYDILFRKFESETVMLKRGYEFGWNLNNPHYLFVLDCSEDENKELNNQEKLIFINEWSRKKHLKTFSVLFQEQIIVFHEVDKIMDKLSGKKYIKGICTLLQKDLVEHFDLLRCTIGIGNFYPSCSNLNKSYQEAKLALKFGRYWNEDACVFHINDLGIIRLLIYNPEELLKNYSEEYLKDLLISDKELGTDYIQTLKIYIKLRGNIVDVANELFIHPNTLRNRLKKIEEMTGIDLSNLQQVSNLIIAIQIWTFVHQESY